VLYSNVSDNYAFTNNASQILLRPLSNSSEKAIHVFKISGYYLDDGSMLIYWA